MKTMAGGALALAAMLLPTTAPVAEPAPVVVELFTSQGCHSCPPADELLGELAERDDILPLSFHVTYWDRLGWPDTLGLQEGTARQENYAYLMGSGRIYTPQMVVHGQIDVVGSQRSRVNRALDIMLENRQDSVELDVGDGRLIINAAETEPATVWLVGFDDLHEVKIERGENRGKTLKYYNSVRELTEIGRFKGDALEFDLPLTRMTEAGRDGAAILVQRDSDGAMLTAARIDLSSS